MNHTKFLLPESTFNAPARPGLVEVATIPLLLVGFLVLGLGWFVGVVLLWVSPFWRLSDKVIGTLLLPGGFAGSVAMLWIVGSRLGTYDPSVLIQIVDWVVAAVCLIGPLYTTVRLTRRVMSARTAKSDDQ
jgi:hypothetical protein